MKIKDKAYIIAIIGLVVGVIVVLGTIRYGAEKLLERENQVVDTETNQEVSEDVEVTENIESREAQLEVEEAQLEVGEASDSQDKTIDILNKEVELIRGGDKETIERYFGSSDVFTPDTVSDRVSATKISLIKDTDGESIVHICTLDYNLMQKDTNELYANGEDSVETEIAKGIVEGKYDVHYNIPITVENNRIKVTEELKQALTGNWYRGIGTTLEQVECTITKGGLD